MESDLQEAAAAVERQTNILAAPLAALIRELHRHPPRVVVTCARGSSAHAATFAKHLIEFRLGIPVAAAAPNIATVYRRALSLKGQLFLAISQSGRSDDLIETAAMARAAGAITAAVVNDPKSPLAEVSRIVLPLGAETERSVAATKSFVASLAALLQLTALWIDDPAMRSAHARLPNRLAQAGQLDWGEALAALTDADSLITIGRGPTLAIAREAALKLKETCELHAEAFSAAEFRHGPIALVSTFSHPCVQSVRRSGGQLDGSGRRSAAQGRLRARRRARRSASRSPAGLAARSSRCRCDLHDPKLLRLLGSTRGAARH